MDQTTLSKMVSSANQHWNTPPEVLDPIYQKFGTIGLDPCSNSNSIVQANNKFAGPDIDHDGLAESWQGYGLVFVNPPYGRKIKHWVKKCADEAALAKNAGTNTEIILLGPARTDTKFFQKIVCPTADKAILWEGRLTFLGAPAPAVFPSFLAYWGPNADKFMMAYLGKGWFIL